jgi:hypothetical protein
MADRWASFMARAPVTVVFRGGRTVRMATVPPRRVVQCALFGRGSEGERGRAGFAIGIGGVAGQDCR